MEEISHQKIAFKTTISLLIMVVIIFLLNSWSNIKLSLDGNIPPLSDWTSYMSKPSTLVSLLAFGVFFYYRNWIRQRELIKNEKAIAAKHQSWLDEK